jgi:hypothetical protein
VKTAIAVNKQNYPETRRMDFQSSDCSDCGLDVVVACGLIGRHQHWNRTLLKTTLCPWKGPPFLPMPFPTYNEKLL